MNLSILEGQYFTLTTTFFDENDVETVPASVRYQIYCKTSRKLVRDWTDVTADSTVSIIVTSEDNAIQSDQNNREQKQLVLEAAVTSEKRTPAKFEWTVENLRGVE